MPSNCQFLSLPIDHPKSCSSTHVCHLALRLGFRRARKEAADRHVNDVATGSELVSMLLDLRLLPQVLTTRTRDHQQLPEEQQFMSAAQRGSAVSTLKVRYMKFAETKRQYKANARASAHGSTPPAATANSMQPRTHQFELDSSDEDDALESADGDEFDRVSACSPLLLSMVFPRKFELIMGACNCKSCSGFQEVEEDGGVNRLVRGVQS